MHKVDKINRSQKVFDEIEEDYAHRLYVDIGRDDGTWMNPKRRASGRKIEFTINVSFTAKPASGDPNIIDWMVKYTFGTRMCISWRFDA
mmetsp:Transcript_30481/g.35151  ORF Transcript_30481/g.35151 Transcript_30481/m.35151 type:complete len:89 (+) Transcript_30481:87-353(+)